MAVRRRRACCGDAEGRRADTRRAAGRGPPRAALCLGGRGGQRRRSERYLLSDHRHGPHRSSLRDERHPDRLRRSAQRHAQRGRHAHRHGHLRRGGERGAGRCHTDAGAGHRRHPGAGGLQRRQRDDGADVHVHGVGGLERRRWRLDRRRRPGVERQHDTQPGRCRRATGACGGGRQPGLSGRHRGADGGGRGPVELHRHGRQRGRLHQQRPHLRLGGQRRGGWQHRGLRGVGERRQPLGRRAGRAGRPGGRELPVPRRRQRPGRQQHGDERGGRHRGPHGSAGGAGGDHEPCRQRRRRAEPGIDRQPDRRPKAGTERGGHAG